ncbi:FAD:protein FMN transferase [hydrothermal vent metagenome]|uniref:FAD:protein FMN transferase n=1 Tax=hydrothermal vent metagenome TaxID=652676 RepID=A0A3B1BLF7_9ZZZZ
MPDLERRADYFVGHFEAMASNCEVLIDTEDENLAQEITRLAAAEVCRIEQKYSRYRNDNILHQINQGIVTRVDEETARLLDYAQQLYHLSETRFDVTSGVLRRVWHFDGSDNIPSAAQIDALRPFIGWEKVQWHHPQIQLTKGMEIDFGGIGKEYAADRAVLIVNTFISEQPDTRVHDTAVLINLGGDLAVTGPRKNGNGWQVGVNSGASTQSPQTADFSLKQGGVATSGDANRYLKKNGIRYGHVLDPHTGWPVEGTPATVTVVAASCTDAGMLSTMALLHGPEAEIFLREQEVPWWCQWHNK